MLKIFKQLGMTYPALLSIMLFMSSQIALAGTWWQDLWFNKDQQGSKLLGQNKNNEAAQIFKDKNWKGTAYYRDGKYQNAYDEFKNDNSAQGLYNQGNALAHLQKYEDAIKAYNKSLELQKDAPDTAYNKELIEKLLQQQKQQQQQNKQNQSDKNKSEKNSEQNKSGQNSDKDQKNSSEQQKDSKSQQNSGQKQDNAKQQQAGSKDQQSKEQNNQQSGSQGDQKDKQQQSGNKQQSEQKQQSGQQQNNAQAGQKPEPRKEQQPGQNTDKQQNLAQPENKDQSGVANNPVPQTTDKEPNGQASTTHYMRPQTPTDKEVKSAISKIPDDPGGLLRNKFLRDYQKQGGNNE